MTHDAHIRVCALALERQVGTDAARDVAERIGAFALAGDSEGSAV